MVRKAFKPEQIIIGAGERLIPCPVAFGAGNPQACASITAGLILHLIALDGRPPQS